MHRHGSYVKLCLVKKYLSIFLPGFIEIDLKHSVTFKSHCTYQLYENTHYFLAKRAF